MVKSLLVLQWIKKITNIFKSNLVRIGHDTEFYPLLDIWEYFLLYNATVEEAQLFQIFVRRVHFT